MKITIEQFKLKFKHKIPIDDEDQFASNLIYYFPFFDKLSEEQVNLTLEEIEEKTKIADKEFEGIKNEYSNLLGEIAKIRFTANELYSQNRVIALTTGLLRHKIMDLHEQGVELPFDYDETIKFVENFIHRYITKKEDECLVEQVRFKEL
ncbi:MAG: hypothetical protein ACTSQE_05830 [Candidatus Heimdallarchaeaceae archaeon]